MFDIVTKIIELSFALVGLLFVVFGWIIPYRQSLKINTQNQLFETQFITIQWEKELVDMQISNLYGPMRELINEHVVIQSLICNQLGRKDIFNSEVQELSKFSESEQLIWKHYVEAYKLPYLKRMISIFQNNQHLIYNSHIPESYYHFLEYALAWELLDNQKNNDVPNFYDYHSISGYPKDFDFYVMQTYDLLLARQHELLSFDNTKNI